MDQRPPRSTFLPFSRPSFGDEEIAGVVEVLRSGWITTGPKTVAFEKAFAEYVGAKHALAVTSGTAGQHILLLALGIGPGDEVIVPSMTWTSTVNIVVAVGATPVFADVDPRTFCLDPADVARRVTPRTRAVIPVHFAGLAADLDGIRAALGHSRAVVIEDAAHAAGTTYNGRHVGQGNPAIYSFHPIKNMTTGEGGIVTTDDDELAARLRLFRFHGVNRDSWQRSGKGGGAGYDVLLPGFKYNMTDIQSVLGLAQLAKLDRFNARRTELAQLYLERLAGIDGLQLPAATGEGYATTHCWHLFTPLVEIDQLDCDRFTVMDELKQENIGTGLHFLAVHLAPYYRDHHGCRRGDLPQTERISDRILSLPLFPDMTEADLQDVCDALGRVLARHRRTR